MPSQTRQQTPVQGLIITPRLSLLRGFKEFNRQLIFFVSLFLLILAGIILVTIRRSNFTLDTQGCLIYVLSHKSNVLSTQLNECTQFQSTLPESSGYLRFEHSRQIDGDFKRFRKGEFHDAHILENSILQIQPLAFSARDADSTKHWDAAGVSTGRES